MVLEYCHSKFKIHTCFLYIAHVKIFNEKRKHKIKRKNKKDSFKCIFCNDCFRINETKTITQYHVTPKATDRMNRNKLK